MSKRRIKMNGSGMDRREALKSIGAVAALAGASPLVLSACGGAAPPTPAAGPAAAGVPELSPARIRELVQAAVATATKLGATHADARVLSRREQFITTEDRRLDHVSDEESRGIGVRVIVDGAQGFAATADLSAAGVEGIASTAVEIGRASATLKRGQPLALAAEQAHQGDFESPREVDPFEVPFDDKVELLLKANEAMLAVAGVGKANSYMNFKRERRTIATSDGSLIEADVLRTQAGIRATAIGDGDAKRRNYRPPPLAGGYELVRDAGFVEQAARVGAEAVEQLKARPVSNGDYDLILLPSHLWLTIHESIGHATELDRVLGMEESLSGGSFATTDQLGKLRYGSPLVNVRALNTRPGYLASVGFDDDGVACQDFDIIKEGTLVGYSTSREVAGAIGAERSNSSCRADSWASIPILRMSNVCLMPGRERAALDDLIADTKRGILIDGNGSFSIDNKRLNFQFGGDAFWEIENGNRKGMLRDVTYQSITPKFWGSLDALADEREWQPHGTFYCGKGDPMQLSQISHACVPARFRNITVRRAE